MLQSRPRLWGCGEAVNDLNPAGVVRFGPYEVRSRTQEVYKGGVRLKLPPKAFQVLRALLDAEGQLVSREELHRALWSADTFVDFDHGLNSAINRLREVLNESAEKPVYIETLPRLGYRFIGQISHNGNGAAPDAAVLPVPALPPVQVPPQSVPDRSASASRWWFSRILPIAAVVLLLLWLFRPSLPTPRIVDTLQLTSDGREKFGHIATDGLRVYFSENISGRWVIAAVAVTGGEPVILPTPFANAVVLNISTDKTELMIGEGPLIEDHALWSLPILGGAPRRLGTVVGHSASWSPDGRHLAFTQGGALYVANEDGTEPRVLVPSPADPKTWAWSPTWSADGRRLRFEYYEMVRHKSRLWEISLDGRGLHQILSEAPEDPASRCCGKWTRDGNYYLYDSWNIIDSGIPWPASEVWGVRETRSFFHKNVSAPFQLTTGPFHFFDEALSPDSNVIYTTSRLKRGEALRYNVRTRQLLPYLSGTSLEGMSFSPDGAWVAYVKFPQGELWRSRIDGSEALQLASRPLVAFLPTWSPDGKRIAFSGQNRGDDWQIYVVSANGGSPQPLPACQPGIEPSWSPDGSSLLFQGSPFDRDSRLRLFDFNKQQISDFLPSRGAFGAHWSPDGRYVVALAPQQNKLLRFDIAEGNWTDWVSMEGTLGSPRWSHDGTSVYFLHFGANQRVFRVNLNEHTPLKVVDLPGFRFAGALGTSLSLTPADEPLLLRDLSGTEIYALHWDAH